MIFQKDPASFDSGEDESIQTCFPWYPPCILVHTVLPSIQTPFPDIHQMSVDWFKFKNLINLSNSVDFALEIVEEWSFEKMGTPSHYGPKQPRIQTEVLGSTVIY